LIFLLIPQEKKRIKLGNNKELKEEQHNIAVQPFALWFLTSFEIAESHKVHGNASGGGR